MSLKSRILCLHMALVTQVIDGILLDNDLRFFLRFHNSIKKM